MNDTGQNNCSDYPFDLATGLRTNTPTLGVDCSASTDADGDFIPPGQDAAHVSAAFSFTKLDDNGVELVDQSSSEFSCVKDNVTGLIWEGKTDSGLHKASDRFTWFDGTRGSDNPDRGDGGGEGELRPVSLSREIEGPIYCYGYSSGSTDSSTFCNTNTYTTRVNREGFCGASDWQVPTMNELFSIINYGLPSSIDTNYFHTATDVFLPRFWMSSLVFRSGFNNAMRIEYGNGISLRSRSLASQFQLRLVRRASPPVSNAQ